MAEKRYDVIVVGAGPAGLGAARTMARLGFATLVIDRSPGPGEYDHVCDAVMVPISETASGEAHGIGLYFPQVDLLVPESLVISRCPLQVCMAPGGQTFRTLSASEDDPPAMIDRAGLLRMMARQAAASGAELLWDTSVAGLTFDGETVAGVRTTAGDFSASLVISAEGTARHLCEQAELYSLKARLGRHALIVSQHLEAPMVGAEDLGRIVTFGRVYSSAPTGYGMLLMPSPGRATMVYTLLAEEVTCASVASAWRFLAEYAQDPRIAGYLEGSHVLSRSSVLIPLGQAPDSVVRDGFMGIGEAVTPAGYLGVLSAIFIGRQAALVAAGALEAGDASAAALAPFDDFFRKRVLPGLEHEAQTLMGLLAMRDDELNQLCHVLNSLHLAVPFMLGGPQVSPATVAWLGQQAALEAGDLDLIGRLFREPGPAPDAIFSGLVASRMALADLTA